MHVPMLLYPTMGVMCAWSILQYQFSGNVVIVCEDHEECSAVSITQPVLLFIISTSNFNMYRWS